MEATVPIDVPESTVSLRDIVALAKPRITTFVAFTTVGGLWLAQRAGGPLATPLSVPWSTTIWAILGVVLIVSGANALNMYMERTIDGLMGRTKNRPLPAGRLAPQIALWFGVITSVAALPILAFGVNLLTCFLAALANILYVLAYTPLKQRSHHALLVGAIPGAIPPLLGWTAATARVDAAGLVLFGILFLWQVPHFLAITLFRREEYARAGLVVMPNVTSEARVKHAIVNFTLALLVCSLLLVPLRVAGTAYLVSALACGITFLGTGFWGFRARAGIRWARALFGVSLLYIVLMMLALGIGA